MDAPDHREQTRRGYDAVASDYARLVTGLEAEASTDVAMIDDFADRCLAAGPGPVADAGCGTGRISAYLSARGLRIVGVDLSPGMLAVAKHASQELQFVAGALEQLPLRNAAFRGLIAWYSVIHTAPVRLHLLVEEFARVLQPSGWLLVGFQEGGGQRVDRVTAYGHEVAMTNYRHDSATVIAVMEAGGFAVDTRLHRLPRRTEKTPQTALLFTRR